MRSLYALTTGIYNVAVGHEAGYDLTTGQNNTLVGHQAGDNVTTGSYNVYLGSDAGEAAQGNTQEVAIGYFALGRSNGGIRNTVIGYLAGQFIQGNDGTNGTNNTIVGAQAGDSITTGYNNGCFGYDAEPSGATSTNQITLGNSAITSLRCADTSISSLSDRRDKTDIVDLPVGLDFIKNVRPVKFKWQTRDKTESKDGTIRAGFIAQELQEAQSGSEYLDLVMDENPEKLEAKQGKLIPVLVKAIQELSARVEELESKSD